MNEALAALAARVEELESQLAFQAQANDSLDATVARQDREILELKRQVQSLRQRLREFGEAIPGLGQQDEAPPHY
ncbi:MAG: SlyX family protein [Lysobacterales bacterium]